MLDTSAHMAQLGALSPVGRSKSLDAAADGYGRGEGCIALVLARPRARAEPGRAPYAVLRGTARTTPQPSTLGNTFFAPIAITSSLLSCLRQCAPETALGW